MRRQFHSRRGEELDRGAEARQRVDEGMDGAAALEVAGNGDLHIAQVLVLRPQREEVAQRLRRMLVAAVAAIDYRDLRIFGGEPRRTVARMADNDDISVIRDYSYRVGEAFAFCGGTDRRIGAGDIDAAKPQHGTFERQPCTGRWLVKKAGEDEFRGDVGAASDSIGDVIVGEFL